MSKQVKVPRRKVKLDLKTKSMPRFITDTEFILDAVDGNSLFPKPMPDIASLRAALGLVKASFAIAQTRVRGASDKLHADAVPLKLMLSLLAAYVECVANSDPDHALDIIASAGMQVKQPSVLQPKTFSVKYTGIHGQVLINSKASRGGFYYYEMSTDPKWAEASWRRIYAGNSVKFIMSGLTPGTRYYLRGASTVKNVQSNWSPVLTIIAP